MNIYKNLSKYAALAIFAIITSVSLPAVAQTNAGFNTTWRVQKYDLDVTLPKGDAAREIAITAKVDVRNISASPATSLTFRLSNNATVSAITINGNSVDFANTEEKVSSAVSLRRLAVRIPSVAPGGTQSATVSYKLTVRDNSATASITPAGGHLLPNSFWYPTPNSWFFSRGMDAAPIRIRAAVSNGASIITAGRKNGEVFESEQNIQPFLYWGEYLESQRGGVAIVTPRGSAESGKAIDDAAKLLTDAMASVTAMSGSKAAPQLRIVAARRGGGFGSGGTVVVDESVLRRGRLDPTSAFSIVESAYRSWNGNSVMPVGDGFGVIGEGLVRFLSNEFYEKQFGKDVADAERTRQRISYTSVSRRDGPMILATPIDDLYFPVVANKGAMLWRILHKRVGPARFTELLTSAAADGELSIPEMRRGFESEKVLVDSLLDQVTETNLLVGLPNAAGGETKVALRNTGASDVTVQVEALLENGSSMTADATIRGSSFGEVSFRAPSRVVRVEIDPEKLYPQIDYSDDVAPRETTDSDPVLAVKRVFDRQEFDAAAKLAAVLLRNDPQLDDLRALYARSLLAKGDTAEAERQYKMLLDQALVSSRSLAWANLGMAELRARSGRNDEAVSYATAAIKMEGETGASLAARTLRNRLSKDAAPDPAIRSFFQTFDRGASANRKAEIDQLIVSGDVNRFASGVSGSTETWQTNIVYIDRLDDNTVLVEAQMNIKLLNRQNETGTAVYRLIRMAGNWRLAAVDLFEVR